MNNFLPLVFLLIVIAHALIDAYQIEKKGIYINHFVEACFYIFACAIVGLSFYFFTDIKWLPLVLFPLITRLAFFDGLLNLFRGKYFLYEGTRSLTDRIEAAIGLPTWLFRIIYILIYIGYTIYFYL